MRLNWVIVYRKEQGDWMYYEGEKVHPLKTTFLEGVTPHSRVN